MLKKSVIIAGRHNTSISLEKEFMEELQNIADEKDITLNELITRIDSERTYSNLSSAVRVFILKYLKEQQKNNTL